MSFWKDDMAGSDDRVGEADRGVMQTSLLIGCPTNRKHPALGSRPEVKILTIVSAQELIMIHYTKHDLTLPCELFWPLLAHEKSNPDIENFISGMDFNSIVLDLKVKGMNTREIHSDLVATLVRWCLAIAL
jgi:hypothetical protein